jgi:BirA family transcriptional regulator, biotin operon repressor / biotin---[acetyl-CoA-carboxylase] ligase
MDHLNANQSGNWHVTAVTETGSTNADLLAQGADGAPDRTVLRADYQSAGRGRLDRSWEAPRGVNLLVSMLFRDVPSRLHVLTQVVALAATQVARDCGVEAVLKWPNDILVGTQKLAGILAQAAPVGPDGKIPFVVVGIGCNLGWAPPEAVSLASSGWAREVSPDEFLRAMLPEIDRLLALNDEAMNAEYVANLATVGSRVRVEMPSGEDIIGRAMSVELDGRLVVLDDCAVTHRIDTADVVHLRPASD